MGWVWDGGMGWGVLVWEGGIPISMSVFYISIISICIFFIVLYREEKHLTTIVKNSLLNSNYSKNTPIL